MIDSRDQLIFAKQAQILKALSEPKRIMAIHALRDGEKTVGELIDNLGLTPTNVSQHLSVLRNAGLVTAQRRGNNVYYSLSSSRVLSACDIVREVLLEQLERGRELAGGLAQK